MRACLLASMPDIVHARNVSLMQNPSSTYHIAYVSVHMALRIRMCVGVCVCVRIFQCYVAIMLWDVMPWQCDCDARSHVAHNIKLSKRNSSLAHYRPCNGSIPVRILPLWQRANSDIITHEHTCEHIPHICVSISYHSRTHTESIRESAVLKPASMTCRDYYVTDTNIPSIQLSDILGNADCVNN